MLTYIFQKYFHDLFQSSLNVITLSWLKMKTSKVTCLKKPWNKYLKKHEFWPRKTFKNHLIYLKDLEISLNIVRECIRCVSGFQMTYRTCSYEQYSLLYMYINHTLTSLWWQGYVRVCLQTQSILGFLKVIPPP